MSRTRAGRSMSRFLALGALAFASTLAACGSDSITEVPPGGEVTTGSLAVSVSGLPSGTAASVTVAGTNFSRTMSASGTLSQLAPGTYTVTATTVTSGSKSYVPSPASQSVDVAASLAAKSVVVTYAEQVTTGSIRLSVDGLPAGAYGSYRIRNSAGTVVRYDDVLQGATVDVAELAPGTYTLIWDETVVGSSPQRRTYVPTSASKQLTIEASLTPQDGAVTYALATGEIALSVSGLPAEQEARYTIRNSAGAQVDWGYVLQGATVAVTNLQPDTYTLIWEEKKVGSYPQRRTYAPTPASKQLTVAASLTPQDGAVTYALATGEVALSVAGLPAEQEARYTIRNSAGETVDWGDVRQGASVLVADLAPGTYTLIWDEKKVGFSPQRRTYAPTPASRQLTVTASTTPEDGAVTYALATGELSLSVAGLPVDELAGFTIRDSAGETVDWGSVRQGATVPVTDLAPGTYTVIWNDRGSFVPSPRTVNVTVTASLTPVPVAVTYSTP